MSRLSNRQALLSRFHGPIWGVPIITTLCSRSAQGITIFWFDGAF